MLSNGESWEITSNEQFETKGETIEDNSFSRRVKKKRRVNHIWRAFLSRCTINGLHFIFDKRPLLQRFIWCIIFLLVLGVFLWQFLHSVVAYFEYKVTTSLKISYVQQTIFPAVTICNFNKYRKSVLNGSTFDKIIELQNPLDTQNATPTNWTEFPDINEINMEKILHSAGHQLKYNDSTGKGMLYHCSWNDKPCSYLNFTPELTDMGLCYTFNSGKQDPLVNVRRAGDGFGLKLTMSVEEDDYFGHIAFSSGLKILIHDQDEIPLVGTYGFAALPGTRVFAAVSREMILSLKPPYETMCEDKRIFGVKGYTTAACHYTCREQYVIKQCKCRAYYMIDKRPPLCTVQQYFECVNPAAEEYTNLFSDRCSCTRPCNETQYNIYLSYGKIVNLDPSSEIQHFNTLNKSEKAAYLRRNILSIDIYYEDLYQSVVEQIPKIKFGNILGEFGGLLGLFVGASVVTVFEFIYVILSVGHARFDLCKGTSTSMCSPEKV